MTALEIGFGIGFGTEVARKLLKRWRRYRRFVAARAVGLAVGWIVDAILLSSPYASSTGGFVELSTAAWLRRGSVLTSVAGTLRRRRATRRRSRAEGDALPEDMSTTSLIGGGLIAGESLFYLAVALIGLGALV